MPESTNTTVQQETTVSATTKPTDKYYSPINVFFLSRDPLHEATEFLKDNKDSTEKLQEKFTAKFCASIFEPNPGCPETEEEDEAHQKRAESIMMTPVDITHDEEWFTDDKKLEKPVSETEIENEWEEKCRTHGPVEVVKFFIDAERVFNEAIEGCIGVEQTQVYDFRPEILEHEKKMMNKADKYMEKLNKGEEESDDEESEEIEIPEVPNHLPKEMTLAQWEHVLSRLRSNLADDADDEEEDSMEFSNSEQMKEFMAAFAGEGGESVSEEEEGLEVEEPEAKKQKKEE